MKKIVLLIIAVIIVASGLGGYFIFKKPIGQSANAAIMSAMSLKK